MSIIIKPKSKPDQEISRRVHAVIYIVSTGQPGDRQSKEQDNNKVETRSSLNQNNIWLPTICNSDPPGS